MVKPKPPPTERERALAAAVLDLVRRFGPIGAGDIRLALVQLCVDRHIRRGGKAGRYIAND